MDVMHNYARCGHAMHVILIVHNIFCSRTEKYPQMPYVDVYLDT